MTSIKEHSKIVRGLSTLLVALAVMSISACGGAKKISTKDNSTDYKSARSLAPLKKPSRPVVAAPQPSAVAPVSASTAPAPQTVSPAVAVRPANNVTSAPVVAISSKIVTLKTGQARMEINADFDAAWDYLSANLQTSDVTVFSRNRAAGRFSIGCSSIDTAPSVVQTGRWSFFNRDKQKSSEYCAIQAVTKRGVTTVSVLNRADEEVLAEDSSKVFQRIVSK